MSSILTARVHIRWHPRRTRLGASEMDFSITSRNVSGINGGVSHGEGSRQTSDNVQISALQTHGSSPGL